MGLSATHFHRLQQIVPTILNECPSLRIINAYYDGFFTEFPANDNAVASDGQAVAKWLFTPLQNDVPKLFKCSLDMNDGNWSSKIEPFKAAFASASSPVNFIVSVWFEASFAYAFVPFHLTNDETREQLAFKRTNSNRCFLLVRCPIARDANKWNQQKK
ncbi:hypothetical protein niasHT_035870 [Heterodera trifolii]|uniref:Uncharacterized protein n=1 Tax=Heterodera trifolii TaxID=157864 RepID=A0ABD2IHR2_9BILA